MRPGQNYSEVVYLTADTGLVKSCEDVRTVQLIAAAL